MSLSLSCLFVLFYFYFFILIEWVITKGQNAANVRTHLTVMLLFLGFSDFFFNVKNVLIGVTRESRTNISIADLSVITNEIKMVNLGIYFSTFSRIL